MAGSQTSEKLRAHFHHKVTKAPRFWSKRFVGLSAFVSWWLRLFRQLPTAEIAEVAVLIYRQRAGEDRMTLILAHRDSIDQFGVADFVERIVAREHVQPFVIVGIGRADEHRARRCQHRIAERFQFGAEGRELSALD